MACPTCDHTMQSLLTVFWCPRCGTVKHGQNHEAPRLVDRCTEFIADLHHDGNDYLIGRWETLGIQESIHVK